MHNLTTIIWSTPQHCSTDRGKLLKAKQWALTPKTGLTAAGVELWARLSASWAPPVGGTSFFIATMPIFVSTNWCSPCCPRKGWLLVVAWWILGLTAVGPTAGSPRHTHQEMSGFRWVVLVVGISATQNSYESDTPLCCNNKPKDAQEPEMFHSKLNGTEEVLAPSPCCKPLLADNIPCAVLYPLLTGAAIFQLKWDIPLVCFPLTSNGTQTVHSGMNDIGQDRSTLVCPS